MVKASRSLELRRLAFIRDYSAYYSNKAAALYAKSRSRLPRALKPRLDVLESRVSAVSVPVVQAMQMRSEQLLTSLDRKVGPLVFSWGALSCIGLRSAQAGAVACPVEVYTGLPGLLSSMLPAHWSCTSRSIVRCDVVMAACVRMETVLSDRSTWWDLGEGSLAGSLHVVR